MPQRNADIYDYEIDVVGEDIDELGHVNNAVYLTWVQTAVLCHWRRLAPSDVVTSHHWVALQHHISYRRPAFLDDHIVVRVILQKFHGATAFYRTIIKHGDDLLAEVESRWCCIDAVTHKPVRLAQDIVARFLSKPSHSQG